MTLDESQAVIDELDLLLERERNALLAGNLDEIARILELKESLLDQVSRIGELDSEKLAPVRDKLSRNQALLSGAMEGIRAVIDRMAELRNVRNSLETYDKNGRRTQLSTPPPGNVEKRA